MDTTTTALDYRLELRTPAGRTEYYSADDLADAIKEGRFLRSHGYRVILGIRVQGRRNYQRAVVADPALNDRFTAALVAA